MIVTRIKNEENLKKIFSKHKKVAFVGCSICAEECGTSGEDFFKEISGKYNLEVVDFISIEGMCNQLLIKRDLKKLNQKGISALISFSCGAGTQALRKIASFPVFTILDTSYLAKKPRTGIFTESCSMCGDCVLNETFICPRTRCSKGILNGPCGGSINGKCEVDETRDCAWAEIYQTLKDKGELSNIEKIFEPLKNVNEIKPRKDSNRK
ncbi:MAG: methylenetetrahydrofolate reductase C-terminal domain-containing protein [Candidatus Muiribacteriota bacterium]